jgi:hypothetical protein
MVAWLILGCLFMLILGFSSCEISKDYHISKHIEQGVDPHEARCAFGGWRTCP